MTYLVHINPTPGSDLRVVEVEASGFTVQDGVLAFLGARDEEGVPINKLVFGVACFSPAVWNYVEPKK